MTRVDKKNCFPDDTCLISKKCACLNALKLGIVFDIPGILNLAELQRVPIVWRGCRGEKACFRKPQLAYLTGFYYSHSPETWHSIN
jgi:hypothetical protein